MKKSPIITSLLLVFFACSSLAQALDYTFVPNALKPPPGMETIGKGHGEIRVDSQGDIYVSVDGQKEGGLQVYGADGTFKKYVPNIPGTAHGFVIHSENGEDIIYAAILGQSKVMKCKTDGTLLLEIPASAFPQDKGKLKLTSVDVGPNGDIYVVDGYGKDWIFVFDKDGKYKTVFGGRGEPAKLSNAHKIFIDPRYEPARILVCDRGNNRLIHLNLDGSVIGVHVGEGLRRPSSASFYGDYVCVAEIGLDKDKTGGRVSVYDKEGKQVAALAANPNLGQSNTPKVEPKDWKDDIATSPHGITFDAQGNILETEWNNFGRVLRWNLQK